MESQFKNIIYIGEIKIHAYLGLEYTFKEFPEFNE